MMRCGYAKCINATPAATTAAAVVVAATTAKSSLLLLQLLADASIIRHVDHARHNDDADDGVADNATVCVVLYLSLQLSLFSLPSLIISAALCGHPNAIKNQSMAHKTNEKCNKIRFELIAGLGVSRLYFFLFLFIAAISY